MGNYKKAINKVIINEGGYSNDPDDLGGETYMGISRKNFPSWIGWKIIDKEKAKLNKKYKKISNRKMTHSLSKYLFLKKSVQNFYKENFWDKIKGDDIVMQDVAQSIVDFIINTGIKPGSKIVQRVVGTKDDGIIGPKSIVAINKFTLNNAGYKFQYDFFIEKIKQYLKISYSKNNYKYLFGWISRSFYSLEDTIDILKLDKYIIDKDIRNIKDIIELYKFILTARNSLNFRKNKNNIKKLRELIRNI